MSVIFSLIAIIGILIAGKKVFFGLARHWARHIMFVSRVKLKLRGEEFINPHESYIFCANHSSIIDIPVMLSAIDHDFRIIYKRELHKIPVFGWSLALSPFISIKRENARDSMIGIEQAVESIRTGESVVIFPEGTRSTDGNIGKFKRGAFMLASRSGKKIVPVTIIGSAKVLPNKKFLIQSGEIILQFSPPIEYTCTSKVEEVKLMNDVYNVLKNNLSEMPKS